MPFDFQTDGFAGQGDAGAVHRTNYHAGVSAEQAVARHYQDRGAVLRETRWRGRSGEIDLILSEGDRVVFVEVKKSRTHAQAVQRVTARQIGRIMRSAEDYLGRCPAGALTDARLDVALVDAEGRIDILPNASMGF
ncbi:YraN family protein [Marivita geojedonensis]|uniref:YraN family protein n=1 Tax=Marivita geojedonensis TaxID=1123756 RepID=UPI000A1F7E2D|nr:YraN family protein [Marivita geojedonensis]PRY80700.1 putative endonuclease [Marivita geojedonensis]